MGTREPPREKDIWDKASIVGQVLVPLMLAVLTFAYSFHESRQRKVDAESNRLVQLEHNNAAKAGAVAEFLPYVRHDADSIQMQVVMAALLSLGYGDVVVHFAQLRPNPSSVQALGALASTADSSAVRESAVNALQQISITPSSAAIDSSSLVSHLAEAALLQAQVSESGQNRDEWAIVTGGFRTLQQAQADADSTIARGFPARVYVRNNVHRTAIRLSTRAEARARLPDVRSKIRGTAYAVDWQQWCPNPQRTGNYFQCGPSRPEVIVNP